MDASRFDDAIRVLTTTDSRRHTLSTLLGATLGLLSVTHPEEARASSGGCQPQCPQCQACQKGECHKTRHGKRCKKGTCSPVPNGSGCGDCRTCQGGACVAITDDTSCGSNGSGRCLSGSCNARPTCGGSDRVCANAGTTPIADDSCCSLECGPRLPFSGIARCSGSGTGQPCYDTNDCSYVYESCIGYVCQ